MTRPHLFTSLMVTVLKAALLGGATTVLVAWFAALRVPLASPIAAWPDPSASLDTARGAVFPGRGCRVIEAELFSRPGLGLYTTKAAWFSGWPLARPQESALPTSEFLPEWTRERLWIAPAGQAGAGDAGRCGDMRSVLVFGWPWPCLWHEQFIASPATTIQTPGGVVVSMLGALSVRNDALPVAERAVLPLRMVPGPFIGCAAVYGAVFFAAFVGVGVLRTRRARRRGACEGCGYDRTGLAAGAPCPECGRGRQG